jgi:intein/homing endonuclease
VEQILALEQRVARAEQKRNSGAAVYSCYRGKPRQYMKEVLGLDLWEKQQDVCDLLYTPPYKVLCKSCHKTGKCVYYKDTIPLADGSRVPACALVGTAFNLLTLVDGVPTPVPAKAGWNGTETVYELTTETGKKILRTGNHPLWVAEAKFAHGCRPRISPLGWTAITDISPGHLIAVADHLPIFGEKRLPDHEVKLLAYLIGDGGMTTTTPTFTQQDNEQLAEFRECAEASGAKLVPTGSLYGYRVVGNTGKQRVRRHATTSSGHNVNPVTDMLVGHGLQKKHSRDKFIPKSVWMLPADQQRMFLSRLFATDGWAVPDIPGKQSANIGYCSISEQLARDVQEMLTHFGIHTKLRYREKVNAWVVDLLAKEHILAFCDEIGIYGKEEAVEKTRASVLGGHSRSRWRHKNAAPGTRWEKVVSITPIGDEPTVAIEVPVHHTYLTTFWEHNSLLAAALICYEYDCYDPSITLSIAPTNDAVKDQLWRQVRELRARAGLGGFTGSVAPLLKSTEWHQAKGLSTDKSEALHGRHVENMLFIIDEGVGVSAWVYSVMKSMFKPTGRHKWLVLGNPTNTASQMYVEEFAEDLDGNLAWHQVTMSALDHPNIAAGLEGRELPFPAAVDLGQFKTWLADWADEIPAEEATATDIEFPPGSGKWYRPGPEMEARGLGRWPSSGTFGVWSDNLWSGALQVLSLPHVDILPEIGCDVARLGDDYTEMHVRCGSVSLHHERHNGWSTEKTAGRLKELCREYAAWATARRPRQAAPIRPEQIRVKIDDDGVGGGVTDKREGYSFIGMNANNRAVQEEKYSNRRSELWFVTAERARRRMVSFARLDKKTQNRLRQQAMAPVWELDGSGRRTVEQKKVMKKRLGIGSPDGMDAVNYAYHDAGGIAVPEFIGNNDGGRSKRIRHEGGR